MLRKIFPSCNWVVSMVAFIVFSSLSLRSGITAPESATEPALIRTPKAVSVNRAKTSGVAFVVNGSTPETGISRIQRIPAFREMLIPLGTPTDAENTALESALKEFVASGNQSTSSIESFLAANPDSTWAASLWLELGWHYFETAYFSKTLPAYERAWQKARNDRTQPGIALGDRAIGELLQMHARLGHTQELKSLFTELGPRELHGQATELVAGARAGLWLMINRPQDAFRCGPAALGCILETQTKPHSLDPKIFASKSTPQGISLDKVAALSRDVGLNYQIAKRAPGAPFLFPAVIHWKVGHYAALLRQDGPDTFILKDPTFGKIYSASQEAIDAEASGYFLVPAGALPSGWVSISDAQASAVWGRGNTLASDPSRTTKNDKKVKGDGPCHGMPIYNVHAMLVSLNLTDIPVGIASPFGPDSYFQLTYNQREATQPTVFDYSNLGPKWLHGWMSSIQWSPTTNTQGIVSFGKADVYLLGGGQETYDSAINFGGSYQSLDQFYSHSGLTIDTVHRFYEIDSADGSRLLYEFEPVPGSNRRFLTKIIDPQGNIESLTYDVLGATTRLRTVTDAAGLVTTLSYSLPADPLKITAVTDPFGRSATFSYDNLGRLTGVTDVEGLVTTFVYAGTGDFINAMTTPYGQFQFAYGEQGRDRWFQVTDPAGDREKTSFFNDVSTSSLKNTTVAVNAGPVPTGMAVTSAYENFRNTFYWDKKAMRLAPEDAASAHIFHWLHTTSLNEVSGLLENEKRANENRVFYSYPGQNSENSNIEGTASTIASSGRVLDDGTTQLSQSRSNFHGQTTWVADPLQRETAFDYASGGIDLIGIRQRIDRVTGEVFAGIDGDDPTAQNGGGGGGSSGGSVPPPSAAWNYLAQFSYNSQHRIQSSTNAAGQITTFTYNSVGQVHTVTDPKGEVTTLWYDLTGNPNDSAHPYTGGLDPAAAGYLVRVDGPASTGSSALFTYDGLGRVRTSVRSDGYVLTYDYDNLDRPTVVTYPDNTYDQFTYQNLDLSRYRDRLGRVTSTIYNFLRQPILTRDANGNQIAYQWCKCGALQQLTDQLGRATSWTYDVGGRLVAKTLPDASSTIYTYEATTSRLKSSTDALNRQTNYIYNLDNSIGGISYTAPDGISPLSPATPAVAFTYDPWFLRPVTRSDGVGTTTFSYYPMASRTTDLSSPIAPSIGAGALASVDGPLANDTIVYTYDEMGRVLSRSINGPNNIQTVAYDPLGRVYQIINLLGTFTSTYTGATGRPSSILYPNGQKTVYNYFPSVASVGGNGDFRIQSIQNFTPGATNLSTFGYGYDLEGQLTSWSTANDQSATVTATAQYDRIGQLLHFAQATAAIGPKAFDFSYDAAGNRTTEQQDESVTTSVHNTLNALTGRAPGGLMDFRGTVSEPSTITVGGSAAVVDNVGNWEAKAPVTVGNNVLPLVAMDGSGNKTQKSIAVTVTSASARSLVYDAVGNLLDDGNGKTYTWDAANRLISATAAGNISSFAYDGAGQRVQEKLNGVLIKQWVWAGGPQPAEERDASGNVTKRFFGGLGQQIGGVNYFFTTDHLGSVREMTDGTGAIRARYSYDPYGRQTKVSGDLEADFGFTGFYHHQTSGLSLTLYRLYDPDLGRWLSRDPSGESSGLNLYQYVDNNPINAVDPLGLWQITVGGGDIFGSFITIGNNGGSGLLNGQWTFGAVVGVGDGFFVSVDTTNKDCKPSSVKRGVYGRGGLGGTDKLGASGDAYISTNDQQNYAQVTLNSRASYGNTGGSARVTGVRIDSDGVHPVGPGQFSLGGGAVVGFGSVNVY